jgi:arsenate reductase
MMKKVLFLCTGNSCRSQMAESMLRFLSNGRFEVFSAGSRPSGHIHPMVFELLRAAKLPTEGLRSKSWDEFKGQPMNFVITLCDRARETCPVWPGQPVIAHWSFEDPGEAEGSAEEKERIFRKVFTEIQARIRLFAALPMDKLSRLELENEVRKLAP